MPDEILCTDIPDDFFDENAFSELQSVDNVIEANDFSEELFKSSTNEHVLGEENHIKSSAAVHEEDNNNRTLSYSNLCQDMDMDFEDFSELPEINRDSQKKVENHAEMDESNQQSWDAFFTGDFSSTQEKVDQEKNGIVLF